MEEKRPSPSPEPEEQERRQAEESPESPEPPRKAGLGDLERQMLRGSASRQGGEEGVGLTSPVGETRRVESPEVSVSAPADQLQALLNVTKRISRFLNLTDLLDQILDAVLEISRCERGFVLLANQEGRLEYMAGRDQSRTTISPEDSKYSRTTAKRVFSSRRPVWEEDLQSKDRTRSIGVLKLETVICLPLLGTHDVVGVLYLDSRSAGHLKMAKDLTLLEAFASQAAVAIENAQLHEEVARQRDSLAMENRLLRQEVEQSVAFENIIGQSGPMKRLFQTMQRVKDSRIPTLISGETGTGKELIARALHFHGSRKDGPFIVGELVGANDDIVWSSLFGHKKGSYTGAVTDEPGYFELADQGTLFLDEVGDFSSTIQTNLLRAVERGEVKRLGEPDHVRKVDVRVISATHRNLGEMIERTEFRQDLYYRLAGVSLEVPPLRDRGDDVRLLCEHFLTRAIERHSRPRSKLTPEAYRLIYAHDWPGNVRELEHAIERAVVLSDPGAPIGSTQFPNLASSTPSEGRRFEGGNLKEKMEAAEGAILQSELEASGWNISQCARNLQCTRQHLHNRIRRLKIERPEKS
jgi:Nif-specific regulatory protein